MLPGKSTRKIDTDSKKLDKNKICNDDEDANNRQLSLQYNLDKLDDAGAYEFANGSGSGSDIEEVDDKDGDCEIYPFASTLEKDVDEFEVDADGEEATLHICIYQINTSCELPFIEYMMKIMKNGDSTASETQQFEFPSIKYAPSKRTVIDQAKQIIPKIEAQEKTASNKNIKEADLLNAKVIAAIIVIILGIALGRSMISDVKQTGALQQDYYKHQMEQIKP